MRHFFHALNAFGNRTKQVQSRVANLCVSKDNMDCQPKDKSSSAAVAGRYYPLGTIGTVPRACDEMEVRTN
jgi:hypothetical protein